MRWRTSGPSCCVKLASNPQNRVTGHESVFASSSGQPVRADVCNALQKSIEKGAERDGCANLESEEAESLKN